MCFQSVQQPGGHRHRPVSVLIERLSVDPQAVQPQRTSLPSFRMGAIPIDVRYSVICIVASVDYLLISFFTFFLFCSIQSTSVFLLLLSGFLPFG
jgi:hypothetical protein